MSIKFDKELFFNVLIFACFIFLMIFILILILDQLSPFKECYDKPDNYEVKFGDKIYTCGELNAINTTESAFG